MTNDEIDAAWNDVQARFDAPLLPDCPIVRVFEQARLAAQHIRTGEVALTRAKLGVRAPIPMADAAAVIFDNAPIEEKVEAMEEVAAGMAQRLRVLRNGLHEALAMLDGAAGALPPDTRKSVLDRAAALRRLT